MFDISEIPYLRDAKLCIHKSMDLPQGLASGFHSGQCKMDSAYERVEFIPKLQYAYIPLYSYF